MRAGGEEHIWKFRALLKALAAAEQLKNNTRHSWTSAGRHESVAEHSWRLALMAYFVKMNTRSWTWTR